MEGFACVISKQEAWRGCLSVRMQTSFSLIVEQGGCNAGGSEVSISPLARGIKTPGETSIVGMDVSSSILKLGADCASTKTCVRQSSLASCGSTLA